MIRRLPLLMLVLSALFLSSKAASEPLRIAENLRHETVLMPLSTPKSSQLTLVDYAMVADEENGVGVVFMYDDAQTKREVDYIELYDVTGSLLLVCWVDRFGIRRIAMDRGLLREEDPSVDGVLVLITDGTTL